jgi:excisionase family DNA binding protein
MEQKQSFSTSEVAKFCHVTPDTIRKWAEADRIKVFKTPGGHRRIHLDDLVSFMRENDIPLNADLRIGGTKILVVGEDPSLFAIVKRFLERANNPFEVETASSGFEAGYQIGVFAPKVVFLDIGLSGIDAVEVCPFIKADHGNNGSEVHIIAMTDTYSEEVAQHAKNIGASFCLQKPFNPDDLRRALALIGIETD